MTKRVLTLVVMVLLLALPHPGSGVSAAVLPQDQGAAHAHHMASGPVDMTASHHPDHHGGLACIAICTGTPLVEVDLASAPWNKTLVAWLGFGAPLSQALAHPATLSRPPNAFVPS